MSKNPNSSDSRQGTLDLVFTEASLIKPKIQKPKKNNLPKPIKPKKTKLEILPFLPNDDNSHSLLTQEMILNKIEHHTSAVMKESGKLLLASLAIIIINSSLNFENFKWLFFDTPLKQTTVKFTVTGLLLVYLILRYINIYANYTARHAFWEEMIFSHKDSLHLVYMNNRLGRIIFYSLFAFTLIISIRALIAASDVIPYFIRLIAFLDMIPSWITSFDIYPTLPHKKL